MRTFAGSRNRNVRLPDAARFLREHISGQGISSRPRSTTNLAEFTNTAFSFDLAAGREYVEAYVQFVHYVERIYQASVLPTHGHCDETGASFRKKRLAQNVHLCAPVWSLQWASLQIADGTRPCIL